MSSFEPWVKLPDPGAGAAEYIKDIIYVDRRIMGWVRTRDELIKAAGNDGFDKAALKRAVDTGKLPDDSAERMVRYLAEYLEKRPPLKE